MATKADFTAEEWKTLAKAPAMAATFIAAASPSGPVGIVKEMIAASSSIIDESKAEHGLQIVKDLAEDLKANAVKIDSPKFSNMEEMASYARTELTQAVTIVQNKAPDEATAYRQWLYNVAAKAAAAAKEGGFLGIGGTAVTPEETAALTELAQFIGVSS